MLRRGGDRRPLALVRDGDIVRIDAAGRQGRRDPPGRASPRPRSLVWIAVRAYQYLEAAVTSGGRPIKFIPKPTELACAELTRRAAARMAIGGSFAAIRPLGMCLSGMKQIPRRAAS
jgi:hypothetical protein